MEQIIETWLLDPTTGRVLASVLVVLAVVAGVKASQRALGRYIDDQERRYRLRKFVTFMGYLVGAFLLSLVFSDKLGGLTVFLGVAGAGVAFALQELIASAAGWVTMSFGNLYKVGDRVQLGGIRGDVIDISVLRTTLMECGGWVDGDLYSGRVVRIGNSVIFKEPVYNYSSEFPFLWDEVVVPVHFGSDYAAARRLCEEVLNDVTGEYAKQLQRDWRAMTERFVLEDARLAPLVSMTLRDDWVAFTLRYVVEYKLRRTTRDRICAGVLSAIDASEGAVTLGCASMELATLQPLSVEVQGRAEGQA